MIDQGKLGDAISYNSKRTFGVLSWPWNEYEKSSVQFAWATAHFQCENRLEVDGKFGPKTERLIRRISDDTSVQVPNPSSAPVKREETFSTSNSIIVDGKRVSIPSDFVDAGITASNFMDDGEVRFKHRERRNELIHFVLHETCGNTAQGCKDTLVRKGYGVQLILNPYGHISCHGDLVRDRMVHANRLNNTSIGMEVVNPYSPIYVRDNSVFGKTEKAEWWTWVPSTKGKNGDAVKRILERKGLREVPREYVTPTKSQLVAARLLVPWICDVSGIPYEFPTRDLNRKNRKNKHPGPGVVAHRDVASHADGRYMLEDLIRI